MEKKNRIRSIIRITLNVLIVAAVIVCGFPLLIASAFGYTFERNALFALFPTTVAMLLLLVNGCRRKRWFKWVALGWCALAAGFGISLGVSYHRLSVPTLDDRSLRISYYVPFQEDTRAVTLDEKSALTLSVEDASSLRIDGATALYPVYASFVQNAFTPSDTYVGRTLDCNGTTYAYHALISGETDVIFCAQPSEKQLAAAHEAGLTLHLTPIGREAFVFFVNVKNPVTGLTVEQVQRIYTGEITNWHEVGGQRQKIRAYQRDEGSGSQTALQRLMAGLPLMEPEKEERIGGMGGIIEAVATYRNYDGALGFTYRFYSNEMVGNDQIRLLALDGVFPTKDTIRDGSYPLSSHFYAITASPIGEPAPEENAPVLRAFLDWCQGEQGQRIVEAVGYVSVQ